MQQQDIKTRDKKIRNILSVAPKLDTITYLCAIFMSIAIYTHYASLYPQNITITAIFFTTTLLVTNFTISIAIDWLHTEIDPHLHPDTEDHKKDRQSIARIMATAVPTVRLFSAFITLVFTIVIYHSISPPDPSHHLRNHYFKYLVTTILFAFHTIYIGITFYGTLMEKIQKNTSRHAATPTLQQAAAGTCQVTVPKDL